MTKKEFIKLIKNAKVDENGNFVYSPTETLSKRFAFDTSNGQFVTDKVFLKEEIKLNKSHLR